MNLEDLDALMEGCTYPLERLLIARRNVASLKGPSPRAVRVVLDASPEMVGRAQKAEEEIETNLRRMLLNLSQGKMPDGSL